MSEIKTVRVIVHGHVQGVCFRATACDAARSFGVQGTVKNLLDGTVEIWVQGNQEIIEAFLNHLKDNPGPGKVSHFDIVLQSDRSFNGFHVVY